jgi:hypothetical protein
VRKSILLQATIVAILLNGCSYGDNEMKFEKIKKERSLPVFSELNNTFTHEIADLENDHEVLDLISFQPYEDGRSAVMVTGGKGQSNAIYLYDSITKEVRDIAQELGLEGDISQAKYGLAVGDISGDGIKDIIIAQENGVYIYSRKDLQSKFEGKKLDVKLPENSTPLDIELSDTQNHGSLDMYISTFIKKNLLTTANFNDFKERVDNVFLKNNGRGKFSDNSKDSGLGIHQNTFMAKFVDLNNNGYPDLIPALNTSQIKIYENKKDGTFKEHPLTEGYGFWMGVATADLNGSGHKDILFTNVGKSIPSLFLRGDLNKDQKIDREYRLFRNKGNFDFYDATKLHGLKLKKFGWDAAFINISGEKGDYKDLFVTENYTHFPLNLHEYFPSKGSLFLQDKEGSYSQSVSKELNISNPYFGYRVLSVDLTGNGFNDLVIANLKGPLRIFENKGY